MSKSYFYLSLLVSHLLSFNEQLTCGMPSTMTHGEIVESRIGEFSTAKSYETYFNTTAAKCIMMFIAKSQSLSMNVVGKNHLKLECQMSKKKATGGGEEGAMIKKDGSTYFEKIENYMKGSASVVNVETKDERPGIVNFQQHTGYYKIKLNHIDGKVSCVLNQIYATHFGCEWNSGYTKNSICLVEDFRGSVIAQESEFSEFDSDWRRTSYLVTSTCYHLTQGSSYSFWYTADLTNHTEHNNSGKTSFEFLVEPCKR